MAPRSFISNAIGPTRVKTKRFIAFCNTQTLRCQKYCFQTKRKAKCPLTAKPACSNLGRYLPMGRTQENILTFEALRHYETEITLSYFPPQRNSEYLSKIKKKSRSSDSRSSHIFRPQLTEPARRPATGRVARQRPGGGVRRRKIGAGQGLDQPRASPAGGRARPGQATPGRAPRPRLGWSGDGEVALCRRPRHSVGSQPGQSGWRLGRRAARGRQHNRNVPERRARTLRDKLVPVRRQANSVVGPARPRPHEREARVVAGRRVPQI